MKGQSERPTYRIAETLEEAARNWERGLKIYPHLSSDAASFYVPRPDQGIEKLKIRLTNAAIPDKWFFSGQRGCGKSTAFLDLKYRPEIVDRYYVFHVSADEEADRNNLQYTDLIFLIATTLADYVEQYGNLPSQEILREKQSWQNYVGKLLELVEPSVDLGVIKVKLKEPKSRDNIRAGLEKDVKQTLDLIERLSRAVEKQESKRPLILMDGVDKPPLEQQVEIFSDNRDSLYQPYCAVVYTFNHSLMYSDGFLPVNVVTLPNISLSKLPSEKSDDGRQYLREVVHRRMAPHLIEPEALELLVDFSGGLLDQLSDLISDAIVNAQVRLARTVRAEDIKQSARDLRDRFRYVLGEKDYELLRRVRTDHALGPQYQRLVHIRAIIEYNGERWLDVNPVLESLL